MFHPSSGEGFVIAKTIALWKVEQHDLVGRDQQIAFPTVYTAVYRPAEARVDYLWPGKGWCQCIDRTRTNTAGRISGPR
jgi:hypothetical protein